MSLNCLYMNAKYPFDVCLMSLAMSNECRKDYYQEGSHVYEELNVLEAFRKAITTWARWVDKNINPMKSIVFFRGYSESHFR